MDMQVLDTRRDSSGGYKVDVSRGSRVGRVSSEWFSRPDDERFLSLGDLARSVRGRSDRSRTRVVETALIHVEANRNDPERLALMLPGAEAPVTPTHWSFGQLASQVGAPAAYLRQLPAPLAAINLQYGLTSNRAEQIKTLETDDPVTGGRLELRAVTGPDYGRIYDHELVEAVQKIAGNGTGDTRWKVPGVLDWSTGIYNPCVDISKDTTTLYASDRDVFLFLVDDLNPIEAGRLKAGLSIEDLAEDIYRRTLLQSINVRTVLNADGKETGMFEVPAGGRRFRALELLVKTKRMAKDQPVPCVVREAGIAEEDSLAENVMRVALHPLDQFRAFTALIEAGLSEEDIAARFFVSVSTVRQRLRLASVSPTLLEVYGEDGMTLEQLMAFSVTDNHARQEQVWEQVNQGHHVPAYHIRRLLTEDAISASDRRVRFIGLDAYTEAGGYVMRDLFSSDEEGWLQDPALVELLVSEKLRDLAQEVGAEGWKWVEAAVDLPYGCERGKRRIAGTIVPLTDEEQSRFDALVEEYDAIGEEYRDGSDLPDDVDARLTAIDAELTALNARPVIYDPEEQARAGVFVSLTHDGRPRIDRGFVRPEDEPVADGHDKDAGSVGGAAVMSEAATVTIGGELQNSDTNEDEDDAVRPLPDRLVSELTAERTVALRDAVAKAPQAAFLALLHALVLSVFRPHGTHGCVQIGVTQAWLGNVAPNLRESIWSQSIEARHEHWGERLPDEPQALWEALAALPQEEQMQLLAHCVSQGVNALFEPSKGYDGRISAHGVAQRIAAADALASVVGLDMAEAGWTPTVDNYLGRVTKPRIIEAVREAKGDATAVLIEHLKKGDMAREAERLLEGTGWLPEPLRLPVAEPADGEIADLPDFLAGGLAQRRGDRFALSRNLLSTLRERDLADAGAALSREHGLPHRQSRSSSEVSGIYRQRVQLASGRFAMIDDGLGFSLVPWSKQLDRHLGQYVSAQPRSGGGIEWTLGRSRSIEI